MGEQKSENIKISNHFIVRYFQRVKHVKVYGINEYEKSKFIIQNYGIKEIDRLLEDIREFILYFQGNCIYKRGNFKFVVENYTFKTVLKK
jgi:hypothetical protein